MTNVIKAWLEMHWVAGALFMGVALLLLVPVGISVSDPALLLIYLASPVYMLHQVEEHSGDRFRTYVNKVVFGGVEALTARDVLWINLPGVWGINLAALYAAHFTGAGYGLAAPYLLLVNGISHLGMAAHLRSYNPGLASGAIVFIPFGLVSVFRIPAAPVQHALGLAIALAIHAAIAIHAKLRAAAATVA
jgi:hypothetical protein